MEEVFNGILKEITRDRPQVHLGNMMRSPALALENKVFAFYHQQSMVFKLDQQAPFYKEKFPGADYLSPFKNRPPMKGWVVVPADYQHHWKSLAEEAHTNLVSLTRR